MATEQQFRLKKPNWIAYLVGAIILAVTFVGPIFVLVGFLVNWSRYKRTLITVKAHSIELMRLGTVTEMPFTKINSVSMARVGKNTYGNFVISLGNDISGLTLVNVENVEALKNLVQDRIGAGHSPAPASSAAPNATASSSHIDELERLAQLKAKGVLTEREYAAEKKRILSS